MAHVGQESGWIFPRPDEALLSLEDDLGEAIHDVMERDGFRAYTLARFFVQYADFLKSGYP